MAVVLKINPGFDASYPWREIGTAAAGAVLPDPLEYYLAPAEKGGEPPGSVGGAGPGGARPDHRGGDRTGGVREAVR